LGRGRLDRSEHRATLVQSRGSVAPYVQRVENRARDRRPKD